MRKHVLLLVWILLPMVTNADPVEIGGIYYNLFTNNGLAQVTSNPNKYTGTIVIPEKVNYEGRQYEVRSIGDEAFWECTELTSVTIPNVVRKIGNYAFYRCTGLTSITIPQSVQIIYGNVFEGCYGLSSIIVESDNISYDSRENCNAIIRTSTNELIAGCKNTIIPNSVTSIDWGAFKECRELTSIDIPNSVISIGGWAFDGCI